MRTTIAAVLAGLATAGTNASAAEVSASPSALSVCLMMSPALAIGAQLQATVLAEVNAIWQPYRVAVRHMSGHDESCDRPIAVRSDVEAGADEVSSDTALAWVPFVEGRARRVVFLRLSRARVLVKSLSPGTRPDAMTDLFVAKLIGRSLAHELGHVLLNSTDHAASGLMRARYRATDMLRDPLSAYTLEDEQRDRIYASLDTDRRLRREGRATMRATTDMVTYRFGPYRLSPERRHLEREGVAVPLTPKAFDLLVTLVRHRARALSKDEILALVWAGAQVEEGNLAQQVLLLRRALADAGDCVATVPRYGYRFVAPTVEEPADGEALHSSPHALMWDGREFPLRDGVTVIGRAEDADLRIPLPSVSRHHARVVVRGLEATLEDLGSRHGSWRGTMRVKGAVRLASADEITLGSVTLLYCLAMPDDTTLG